MSRAVIFANGQVRQLESVRTLLQEDDFLIAADGGTRHILLLGLLPAVIVGDLDSLSELERKRVEASGIKVVLHPVDKNETDFELALHYAVEQGYMEILVIGALGGRLDQTLGNLAVLTGMEFAGADICMDDGVEAVRFTRAGLELTGDPGDIISLIPWGGEVSQVTTSGLRWPLHAETLSPDKTRGISNELLGSKASVTIGSGLLLVIRRRARHQNL